MKEIEKKITELSEKYDMFPHGTRVLCAVSGGADSMFLLHWLSAHSEKLGISITAAHFEHGIRGEESLRDCRFVEEFCREHGIAFVCEHGDVPRYASDRGIGTEEAARELRYAFLKRTAQSLGCSRIATAHNADDNAETILFNLIRGAGSAGLCGIPPVRENIVRPLLGVSRDEIESYLKENGVPHVEDSTNSSDDYTRNRIRHEIVPLMKKINPAFSASAGRTAELLKSDDEFISGYSAEFIASEYADGSVSVEALSRLHPAVASRVIRMLCPKPLQAEHVAAALKLISLSGRHCLDLPGIRLVCEQGRLYFGENDAGPFEDVEIIPGRTVCIRGAGVSVTTEETVLTEEVHGLFNTLCIKYDVIAWPLFCTARRPGDSMSIAGRACSKTLKKLFTENGWTQKQRNTSLVFRDGSGILTVCNLALSDRAQARLGDRILKITINNLLGDENG